MVPINTELNFLLVDDDELLLGVYAGILNNFGYDLVDSASNGNIALGKVISGARPYDIIICDLNMPEMDGVEFLRHLNESQFDGGLILASGENHRVLNIANDMAGQHNLNILGAIAKPVVPIVLQELIAGYEPRTMARERFEPVSVISEDEIEQEIQGETDSLTLYLQPIVRLRSGEVASVEALARWNHEERGLLGPETFIPTAVACGQITALSRLIFKKAIEQTAGLLEESGFLRISVNFSVESFKSPRFVDDLVQATKSAGIEPARLVLEVSERQLHEQASECMEALMNLHFQRYGLSIDDFTCNEESLANLEKIPFTELKVSRAFVNGAVHSRFAREMLHRSVSLARKLGMESVAKGIRSIDDWNLVEEAGFDYAQGTYCGSAMSAEKLKQHLDNWVPPRKNRNS